MSDLDTLIRIRLERMILGASDIEDHCNAIRAVLKLCDRYEERGPILGKIPASVPVEELRRDIARELGVSDE